MSTEFLTSDIINEFNNNTYNNVLANPGFVVRNLMKRKNEFDFQDSRQFIVLLQDPEYLLQLLTERYNAITLTELTEQADNEYVDLETLFKDAIRNYKTPDMAETIVIEAPNKERAQRQIRGLSKK